MKHCMKRSFSLLRRLITDALHEWRPPINHLHDRDIHISTLQTLQKPHSFCYLIHTSKQRASIYKRDVFPPHCEIKSGLLENVTNESRAIIRGQKTNLLTAFRWTEKNSKGDDMWKQILTPSSIVDSQLNRGCDGLSENYNYWPRFWGKQESHGLCETHRRDVAGFQGVAMQLLGCSEWFLFIVLWGWLLGFWYAVTKLFWVVFIVLLEGCHSVAVQLLKFSEWFLVCTKGVAMVLLCSC